MHMFVDAFHSVLQIPVPNNDVVLADSQLGCSGARPAQATALLQYQHAVMQQMKQAQPDVTEPDDCTRAAVLHNLHQLQTSDRSVVDLPEALRGPAYVAKLILRSAEDKASKPERPFRYNSEQLECIAAMVAKLELAFAEREDPSQPFINAAKVLTTAIFDGGGGCGKTELLINVMVPLWKVFFGPHGLETSPEQQTCATHRRYRHPFESGSFARKQLAYAFLGTQCANSSENVADSAS